MRNCTITGCLSTSNGTASGDGGGGYYAEGGAQQYHLGNSIIAGNGSLASPATNPDVRGNFTTDGHNFIGNVGFSTGLTNNVSGDQVGTSSSPKIAQLDALKNNGGPTDTHALLSASTAINAGDDALAPPADQRGYLRNGISDVGAFEFGGLIPPTLANISTRLRVETGDNVLIGGFIVTGTQPKKIIVRAIGPSLPFADKLADPILELHDSSGALLETNDNWVDSPNKQATRIAGRGSLRARLTERPGSGRSGSGRKGFTPRQVLAGSGALSPPRLSSKAPGLFRRQTRPRFGSQNKGAVSMKKFFSQSQTATAPFGRFMRRHLLKACVLASVFCTANETRAATFNIANGDVAGFRAAINTANTNNQIDVINLEAGGNYFFTTIDSTTTGANALPRVGNDVTLSPDPDLTIHGNGATLQRSTIAGVPDFRFIQIIAGTIVVGSASQKVIIRAIGPSLPIAGKLENPTLELRDGSGTLLEANDNWVDSPNKQAILDSTIPPGNDLESAIVRTLSPANYTAIVRGVNGTTGIAVVEVYGLN